MHAKIKYIQYGVFYFQLMEILKLGKSFEKKFFILGFY